MAKALENYGSNRSKATLWKPIIFLSLGVVAIGGCHQTSQSDIPTASPHDTYYETLPPATTALLSSATVAQSSSVATAKEIELAPSELQEFDSIMLELDPEQQLITSMTQWQLSTTVHVTLGPGFKSLSKERQHEVLAGIQGGLAQVCLCSPELKFSTEDDQ